MKKFLIVLKLMILPFLLLSQNNASINGVVVDVETGDNLISASVMLKDANGKIINGARTKFNGTFVLKNVKPGTYNLTFNYLGYQSKTIENILIKPGEKLRFDIELSQESVLTDEVVVEAKAVRETGAALLKERQKAASAQDAIGGEEMTKKGAGNAGEALKKVTGVTIKDGKSLVVRGLSNRYAKTQLNGASLPSADPDSRSVDLDMFSSNMIENIVTIKTATPDKPGDFTGGAVDITTKSYPDKFFTNFSMSGNYNFQVTGSDLLLSNRSSTDIVAMDDGMRDISDEISFMVDKYGEYPNVNNIFRKEGQTELTNGVFDNAEILQDADNIASQLNDVRMSPINYIAKPNLGMSLGFGNQYKIGNSPLGFTANLNYNRDFSYYNNGVFAVWERNDTKADSLNAVQYFNDQKGTESVLLGGMVGLATTLFNYNELKFNLVYNQASENTGRNLNGRWPGSSGIPTRGFSSWANRFVERDLLSMQFAGSHKIPSLLGIQLDWQVTNSTNNRYEPNFSLFGYDWVTAIDPNVNSLKEAYPDPVDPQYGITASAYDEPARIFRDMNETNLNYKADIEIPLEKVFGIPFDIKTGFFSENVDRSFEEYWLIYKWGNKSFPEQDINGESFSYNPAENPEAIFTNLVGTSEDGNFVDPNMYIQYQRPEVNSYDAEQTINAFYGMLDFKLFKKLRIIAGARVEDSRILATPRDTSQQRLNLFRSEYLELTRDSIGAENVQFTDFGVNENDILPSVNIVYEAFNNFNIRGAYYRTLARPNLREIAPYNSFDFIGGFLLLGNPFLKRTLIDNYDLRVDYFPNPGEIFAVSVYYKSFENPIERSIVSTNGQIRYQNAETGYVIGSEFEIRKNLMNLVDDFTGNNVSALKYFDVAVNLSLTQAQVDIPKNSRDADIIIQAEINKIRDDLIDNGTPVDEALKIAEETADPDLTRDFIGQSPYVINFDVAYSNPEIGLNISSNFNVFGKRLDFIQLGIDPDVYELPRPDLNLIVSKRFMKNFKAKLSVNNILNSWTSFSQEFNGIDFYSRRYRIGTSMSLSLSYTFN